MEARLRAPFVSASRTVGSRELLLLSLQDEDGVTGYGEAAPLGIAIDDVRAAIEDCRPALESSDGSEWADLLAECARLAVLPQALAAIDLALWDLAGKRAGQPVWQLLGVSQAAPVELNATIAAEDRAGAAEQAAAARAAGFRCVKVKVGLGDDAGRLAAVRAAAGPEMAIRLDANGTWSIEEALASLRVLEPAGLECCEEPVNGLDALAAVSAQTTIPISLDESTALPGALEHRVCDAACLKISRCGGIAATLDAARRARGAGYEVYLASMLDGPLGIAAALHAAAAIVPDRPCGLATLPVFDGREDPLPPGGGAIAPPAGPGLGEGLLIWYRG
jgi:L-Ala-D/L-Glu epimerase / N-acetyl-D-glutamate racemase